MHLKGRVTEGVKDKEKEILPLEVHSPGGYNSWG